MNKIKNNQQKSFIENNEQSLIKNKKLKLSCTLHNFSQYTTEQIEINEHKMRTR